MATASILPAFTPLGAVPMTMAGLETLYFDERGTPIKGVQNDRRFIVGGFAIRGDTSAVAKQWSDFQRTHNLRGVKGRRYPSASLVDVAGFLCQNKIVPITSYSRLTDADETALESKLDYYRSLGKDPGRSVMGKSHFAWAAQVAYTAILSVAPLLMYRGPAVAISLNVDQVNMDPNAKKLLQCFFERWLHRDWWIPQVRKAISECPHDLNGAAMERSVAAIQRCKVDLNAKGVLASIADAVCALYGRSLQGESEAGAAWHVLGLCFCQPGTQRSLKCMDQDLTRRLRESAHKRFQF